jgi:GAF domain-containing protein
MPFKVEHLRSVVTQGGLVAGLQYLNDPIQHRYTGVYRLGQGLLRNIELFDKAAKVKPEFLMEVPLGDSFCQFVLRDGVFRTDRSGQDDRLEGHKYQGVLLSYHGVPVLDNQGELFGTLYHFDAAQRTLADEDFAFLQQAARVLPGHLPR